MILECKQQKYTSLLHTGLFFLYIRNSSWFYVLCLVFIYIKNYIKTMPFTTNTKQRQSFKNVFIGLNGSFLPLLYKMLPSRFGKGKQMNESHSLF